MNNTNEIADDLVDSEVDMEGSNLDISEVLDSKEDQNSLDIEKHKKDLIENKSFEDLIQDFRQLYKRERDQTIKKALQVYEFVSQMAQERYENQMESISKLMPQASDLRRKLQDIEKEEVILEEQPHLKEQVLDEKATSDLNKTQKLVLYYLRQYGGPATAKEIASVISTEKAVDIDATRVRLILDQLVQKNHIERYTNTTTNSKVTYYRVFSQIPIKDAVISRLRKQPEKSIMAQKGESPLRKRKEIYEEDPSLDLDMLEQIPLQGSTTSLDEILPTRQVHIKDKR